MSVADEGEGTAVTESAGSDGRPAPSWGRLFKVLLIGGFLIHIPEVPVAWIVRLICLGWLLELVGRTVAQGGGAPYPSWRSPWQHFKRGVSFCFEAGVLLLPASYMLFVGWRSGWIISFEHVPEYHSFGALTVLGGLVLHAPVFMLLPAGTVFAAREPGTLASWRLGRIYEVVKATPAAYGLTLLASYVLLIPLLVARSLLVPGGARWTLGFLSFGYAMLTKVTWAKVVRRAEAKLVAGEQASPWLYRPIVGLMLILGWGYGLSVVVRQFLMFESEAAWFAHFLFLLPGTPAPVGGPIQHW